jgi:opacity protein-like surface antigen
VKRTKNTVLVFASFFSIFTTSQSIAAPSIPAGWYVSTDLGLTRFYGKTYPDSSSIKTSGKAWGASAGYKFLPYFGLEGGYTRYMDTRIRDEDTITIGRDRHYGINVAGKFIYPIGNCGVEIYGKLGATWLHSQIGKVDPDYVGVFNTSTQTAVGFYWGAGAEYFFTTNVGVHLQYAQAQGNSNTGTMGMGSIGFSFLF